MLRPTNDQARIGFFLRKNKNTLKRFQRNGEGMYRA